ncbi:Uncharacterized protein GBIM_15461 [Gryllus bimaculatus]|nr:Uncharacterized protein GBIM_15461 [Gryllus bimaculatus]
MRVSLVSAAAWAMECRPRAPTASVAPATHAAHANLTVPPRPQPPPPSGASAERPDRSDRPYGHRLRAGGIQITHLNVPTEVRNGSSYTILDCVYSLKPDEVDTERGLVVKWYFNNGPSPVYQWIPGMKPQDLGVLRGRLNVLHRVTDNVATMHRALYILNPTTDLSGEYKCHVSTFEDEDFMTKKMVVYGESCARDP